MATSNVLSLLLEREAGGSLSCRNKSLSGPPRQREKALQDWVTNEATKNCFSEPCFLNNTPRSTISAAFNWNGTLVASTHGDHTVKIIDYQSGVIVKQLEGHLRTPWTVRFHPTIPYLLVSGSLDCEVKLWDIDSSSCLQSKNFGVPSTLGRQISSICFHPSGKALAVAAGHKLYIWKFDEESQEFNEESCILKTERTIRTVHFHPICGSIIMASERVEPATSAPNPSPSPFTIAPSISTNISNTTTTNTSFSTSTSSSASASVSAAVSSASSLFNSHELRRSLSRYHYHHNINAQRLLPLSSATEQIIGLNNRTQQVSFESNNIDDDNRRNGASTIQDLLFLTPGNSFILPAPTQNQHQHHHHHHQQQQQRVANPIFSFREQRNNSIRVGNNNMDNSSNEFTSRHIQQPMNVLLERENTGGNIINISEDIREAGLRDINYGYPSSQILSSSRGLNRANLLDLAQQYQQQGLTHLLPRIRNIIAVDGESRAAALERSLAEFFNTNNEMAAFVPSIPPPPPPPPPVPVSIPIPTPVPAPTPASSYMMSQPIPPGPGYYDDRYAQRRMGIPQFGTSGISADLQNYQTIPQSFVPRPLLLSGSYDVPALAPPALNSDRLQITRLNGPSQMLRLPNDNWEHMRHAMMIPIMPSTANDIPCITKLVLYRFDLNEPHKYLSEPMLSISDTVICSEMGANISPCGRMLAFCTATQIVSDLSGSSSSSYSHISQPGLQYNYEIKIMSLEPHDFGAILRSRPISAGHCLTSVQFSPGSDMVLLSYGKRHSSLLRSLVSGDQIVANIHTLLEIYSVSDLALVRVLHSSEDEANTACFHPFAGEGLLYGTKNGKVRTLRSMKKSNDQNRRFENELVAVNEVDDLSPFLSSDL